MIFLYFYVFNENKTKGIKIKRRKKTSSKFILVVKKKIQVAYFKLIH